MATKHDFYARQKHGPVYSVICDSVAFGLADPARPFDCKPTDQPGRGRSQSLPRSVGIVRSVCPSGSLGGVTRCKPPASVPTTRGRRVMESVIECPLVQPGQGRSPSGPVRMQVCSAGPREKIEAAQGTGGRASLVRKGGAEHGVRHHAWLTRPRSCAQGGDGRRPSLLTEWYKRVSLAPDLPCPSGAEGLRASKAGTDWVVGPFPGVAGVAIMGPRAHDCSLSGWVRCSSSGGAGLVLSIGDLSVIVWFRFHPPAQDY